MTIDSEAVLYNLVSCSLSILVVINEWTTSHPYLTAGGLVLLVANPELLLTPLEVVGRAILSTLAVLCMLAALPFQLLAIFFLWLLGFRRAGVERDTFAAHYQSRYYHGYIPPNSLFSRFQSYGATNHHDQVFHFHDLEDPEESPIVTILRLLACLCAMFVLGREWGLWEVQVEAAQLLM
ncbi:hypothetical protein V8B97DRAFT_216157 [Scleroderma yunnanense]